MKCHFLVPFLSPVPEVHDLEGELHDVIDWIPFGLCLGIRLPELKTIEANYPTLQRRRIEMLEEWQNNATPTWSAVVQTLAAIGMRHLASELAQKHGWLNSHCYHDIRVARKFHGVKFSRKLIQLSFCDFISMDSDPVAIINDV